jgi:hypothetical protein
MENWIDIKGFEGLYQVSDLGNVKSLGNNKLRKEKILKQGLSHCGYKTVCLSKNNKCKTYTTHRLVAMSFILNNENKRTVNHRNGIKINNNAINLEWCTTSENTKHAYDNGLIKVSKAECHVNSKLTNLQVLEIRKIGRTLKQRVIADMFGVRQVLISNVLNNISYNF